MDDARTAQEETMSNATAITNARTREQWAEIINADWRKSIDGIVQTGRDLIAAKKELAHGEFQKMGEEDLLFSATTAQQLMSIARQPQIANADSSVKLPSSWRVLAPLSRLSKEDFEAGVNAGIISSDTSLRAADAYKGALSVPAGETWGERRQRDTLPSPSEASQIARATGRMVAASDGHVYSGASEEEGEDHVRRRQQTYGAIDAINTLANCPVKPSRWVDQAEFHWLHNFELGAIDAAITWLSDLRTPLARKKKVVDAE